ncbi:hypothetical protein DPX16_5637 [Anabarilius grahami]|uniref:Retrotransposon gag domain-containing protein n=1 Tax=Anabarilius grahami TaxID=495550 RepID=A0A3N0YPY7_ANAGA|nr:hypothetical protein DPX16_5637 [Anabarilius grahami]
MNQAVALLHLRQCHRPIEDYVQDFCGLCYLVGFNDRALRDIFCAGLDEPISSRMPRGSISWSLMKFIDHALLLAGSSFTVGFADEGPRNPTVPTTPESLDIPTVMSGVVYTTPGPVHATTPMPNPVHVMPARSEPVHVTSSKPQTVHVMPAQPQTVHVTPAQPQSVHIMPAHPEPRPKMAAIPEPGPKMTAMPEPSAEMAAMPEPSAKTATPQESLENGVLTIMATAILCVWTAHTSAPVPDQRSEVTPAPDRCPEGTPASDQCPVMSQAPDQHPEETPAPDQSPVTASAHELRPWRPRLSGLLNCLHCHGPLNCLHRNGPLSYQRHPGGVLACQHRRCSMAQVRPCPMTQARICHALVYIPFPCTGLAHHLSPRLPPLHHPPGLFV